MRCFVAIDHRHLNIHQDDIRLGVFALLRCLEIFQGFFAIPYSLNLETEFLYRLQGDLLVNSTMRLLEQVTVAGDREYVLILDDEDKDLGSLGHRQLLFRKHGS